MTPAQRFYEKAKSLITKDSDLPNLFVYHLTIERGQPAVRVSEVRQCYLDCDLHPPSWLASHFSVGLRSKPRRFITADGGYRLEGRLREKIADLLPQEHSSKGVQAALLAGIEYHGVAGASKECESSVVRLLQFGDDVIDARILTCSNRHCLLLTVNIGDLLAIKSGFSSGYSGEGPRAFSYVLQLLHAHGCKIEEYEVDEALIERLDNSALHQQDLDQIEAAKPVRPSQWNEYIFETDFERSRNGTLWLDFPPVMPLAIIDSRIADLAVSFWKEPDDRLLKGYRRLEDIVRTRTGIDEHGAKLFSQAFIGGNAKLNWKLISDQGERTGRANLFTAAFMAHRNPRAHREIKSYQDTQLAEFLLLNHLFRLEREAEVVG